MTPFQSAFFYSYELYQKKDYGKAEEAIRELLNSYASNKDVLALGAITARRTGSPIEGLKRIRSALKYDSNNHEYYNSYGNLLSDIGDFVNAEQAYTKSIQLNPSYVPAFENLGFMYSNSNHPEAALNVFEKLTEHFPQNSNYHLALAQSYKDCLNFAGAKSVLETLKMQGNQSNALKIIEAQLFQIAGELDHAIKLNLDLLSGSNPDPIALGNIAQIYKTEGNEDALRELLNTLMSKPGLKPDLFSRVVLTALNLEEYDLCHKYCDTFENHSDQLDLVNSLRAQVFLRQETFSEAKTLSQKYLKGFPSDIQSLATYVRACMGLELFDEANKATLRARALAPLNQFWIAMEATLMRARGENHRVLYNYDNFVRPYQVYDPSTSELPALRNFLETHHKSKLEPIDQSLRSGTQTTQDLRFIKDPIVQKFWEKIDPYITKFLETIGSNPDHPFTSRNKNGYRSSGAWSVRLRGSGYHVNHVHPMGWISGAFYLEVPKDVERNDKAGWLKLGEPSFQQDKFQAEHFVKPQPGRMVLFPSYMWHGTFPIEDASRRMTLSFDLVPTN